MNRIVVLGDLNLDVYARTSSLVEAGGEVRSTVRAVPGGSAGTFARVAASEGASVSFIGSVGNDLIGGLLIQSLRDCEVEPFVVRVAAPSGAILALEQGDERTMVCSRGANDGLTPADVSDAPFHNADHLHVSGYAILSSRQLPAARRAIDLARQRGMTISIDPPPAGLIEAFGVAAFLEEAGRADWLFPNLAEGKILTGRKTPEAIVDSLSVTFPLGSLTLASSGALAWDGSERSLHEPEDVVSGNTTGAGDAYAAAFVVAHLGGKSLDAVNALACAVAADRIRHQGTPSPRS